MALKCAKLRSRSIGLESQLSRGNARWKKQGICPVYCGETGGQNALNYAEERMGYGRCDIEVLDESWNVVETIANKDLKPVV
jgi:hypothetical protein